ncbi:MAG: hypothetical protein OES24_02945 [Acidimicrobiia bacterium]|nr:hypothetical protein [Acidimicrobiia bacterium]
MAANRKTDSDHMVVVPHTPREDAIRRGYKTWLREVDNPIFNRMPGVVRYANWRVCAPNPAVPFTNIDFLRLVGEQEAAELATNPELAEHAASWTKLWGRYPDASDDDAHLNGHLYLCQRLAGRQSTTRFLSLQTALERPTDESGDAEIWEVTMPVVGDARFKYLRLVPLTDPSQFAATEEALPQECLGAALAELIAAPDLAHETSSPASIGVKETVL